MIIRLSGSSASLKCAGAARDAPAGRSHPWHGPRAPIPSPPPVPRLGPSLLPFWGTHCNYWNQTTRKYLGQEHRFGINHRFNLTESDPTVLAATSPLPSHPRSRCRVSEGNETCSLPCLVKACLSDQPETWVEY